MRQLNRIAEREVGLYLDGIRFGLLTASMAYERIESQLRDLGDNPLKSPPLREAIALVSDCWLLLDTTDRTREIVDAFSLLNDALPARKQYLSATRVIRTFRNTYHHFHQRTAMIPERSPSIFGGVFWVSPNDDQLMHALILKSGALESTYSGLVYDRLERKYTTKLQFQAYGQEIDLQLIAEANDSFSLALEEMLESRGISAPDLVSGFRFSSSMAVLNKVIESDT